ncbi:MULTISPECIES: rodlin [unclassified Streptomyces]|uniref:rodlin n=1 Tax=unclassified Streptomyces TaxID=2593676 RepID=UPI0023B945C8|nr:MULTISPECIES: rodlin [unclassified Streptomyces]WEH38914.1 rodlin [Streptomyces sp. AM 2-1-1]
MKKMMTGAAMAVSLIGLSVGAAPMAMAIGNDGGTTTVNGNGAESEFGNSETAGAFSPQNQLIQGTLNKLCLGVPVKANVGSLIGLVPITVQDVNVLSNPQNQQCADNSTQAKGDEPLSHVLDDIPVLSGNGVANN